MANKNNKNIIELLKKIRFTGFIILVYLLGHNLLLPIGKIQTNVQSNHSYHFITVINAITGGNFSILSVFSLGISPWMSTLILWQLVSSFENLAVNKLSAKSLYRVQLFVTMVIAAIQAAALLFLQFEFVTRQLPIWHILSLLIVLVAGSVFVVWLGNINAQFGLGGSMLIVIIGMVLSAVETLLKLPWDKILILQNTPYLLIAMVVIYFYIWQIVAMSQAEYRIPIRRILIHQDYNQDTYLPIQLLPSGGMQFMYGMILFSLLATTIQMIQHYFHKIGWLTYLSKHLTLSDGIGLILYSIVLAMLCFSFSNLNFNTEEVSKGLQKSGDYLLNIMPGEETKRYLDKVLLRITLFEIVYSCLMTGLPLIYTIFYPQYRDYAMSVTMFFILIAMSLRIIQEVRFILQYDTTPSVIEYVQKDK